MKIVRAIENLPIPEPMLAEAGWTKMEVLAKHLTPSTWEQLLKLALENTARNLKRFLIGQRVVPGARCVVMFLSPEDYNRFAAKAIVHHDGEVHGLGFRFLEQALMNIVAKVEGAS